MTIPEIRPLGQPRGWRTAGRDVLPAALASANKRLKRGSVVPVRIEHGQVIVEADALTRLCLNCCARQWPPAGGTLKPRAVAAIRQRRQ